MADHAEDGDDDGVFVYMGGSVPQHLRETITHVRIHKSFKIITARAFEDCKNLVSIEMHEGVAIIEEYAFCNCYSLREIELPGVMVIIYRAFWSCTALEDVEFGDKLEIIGQYAFSGCYSLRSIKLPTVRVIEDGAFASCEQLTDVDFSKDLEQIDGGAFEECPNLRRIAIPLTCNLLDIDIDMFIDCPNLSQVDLVGGIHKTISSLFLDSWRNEMNDEINQINYDLPNTPDDKLAEIHEWMERVLAYIRDYKSEHYALLKNNMTQLELALWKANLPNVAVADRQQARVTCGANIIIPHVLSFLNDDDEFPLLNQNA